MPKDLTRAVDIVIGNPIRNRGTIGCGPSHPTLIIASIGTSGSRDRIDEELSKAQSACEIGAGAVTDHSFYGDIDKLHRSLVSRVDALVSTVACYEFAAVHQKRDWVDLDPHEPIRMLEQQVRRGLDLITVHASLSRADIAHVDENNRLIPTTSKGGGIISNYMRTTRRENPYLEYFDDVLQLFAAHGVALSLGTTFRSASVCDKWDRLLAQETAMMGKLVERARAAGVPVMVEGFGHAAVEEIPTLIALANMHTAGAPYRVLPMATDRGLGFDHISGAVATSVAVAHGAAAVTAMSRAEHIGLPNDADLKEAIISARIGAACGELTKLRDYEPDRQMSRTRWAQGCKGDWSQAVYPVGAEEALRTRGRLNDQLIQCGMCGDFCGINAGIASVKLGPARFRDA